MTIQERIRLGNNRYYIKCNLEYKIKDGINMLCLKDYKDDYYDGGDVHKLIEEVENNYNKDSIEKYDYNIYFLSNCLYIYDNIPFISGVGDYYLDKDNEIYSISYITKEELDNYIKENDIKMKDNSSFKLFDGRTWNVNK